MEDFIIRKYRSRDEVEINRLFNEIFGATRSPEKWHWKFNQNPTNAMMIAVAERAAKTAGQYADVTTPFKYLDWIIPFAMPVDNFVHARFQGG